MIKSKVVLSLAALAAACAVALPATAGEPMSPETLEVVRDSFRERGIAKLDRLDQTELQAVCSQYSDAADVPAEIAERLQAAALEAVKYPADGQFLGDWRAGERVAQSGRGLQFTDNAETVAGGNCYACHQMTKEEISFGNIGPSLYNYGKLRGDSEAILKYTWARIWNAHSFRACVNMPRFGDAGILTEQQIKDVMALLLAADSPVNQ